MTYRMADHANREQWAWQTLPTFRPCFPPRKCKIPHPQMSLDEYLRYGPLGFQICKNKDITNNEGNDVVHQRLGHWTRVPLWVTCPWAGQSRLSSSGQWEQGLLERHSGTWHSPPPAPPHFWAASQRSDALEGITNTISVYHNYSLFIFVEHSMKTIWRGRQTRNWNGIRICNDTSWFKSHKWNWFNWKSKPQQENHSLR